MSIFWKIPPRARFVPVNNTYRAWFNDPSAPGQYTFTPTAGAGVGFNVNQTIIRLEKNAVYLIERATVAGDTSEATYSDSIATIPRLTMGRRQSNIIVYQQNFPIASYLRNVEVAAFVKSDKGGDELTGTVTGVLNQVPATVGRATLDLNITLSLYIIDSNWYSAQFEAAETKSVGRSLRR